ncbi:MAG: DNA polymerase III subunit gamma/tau [Thiobacillaceae bacterium]|jgi:DNA polymerase-3 subunit gamma/tau
MNDLFGETSQPALALARKWRPRSFADLKGQEHVVQALSNALTQGRLHHAYLFTGTRGVGKTTLARIIAKCLNCETGVTATPCGACSACTQIDAGRFVDLLELDAASNTGVDNMREVLDNAQYAPTVGRYKVYIIDEVHMLSKPAFNSMLKTLEEPPAHVKFILATTDPQKIPVTVLSRCLQFNLKPMPVQLVASHLGDVLEKEQVQAEPAALMQLARAASGSMRDALSLTDQAIAYGGGKLEAEAVEAMLGTVGQEHLFSLLNALALKQSAQLMQIAGDLAAQGFSFDGILQDLGALLTRIAQAQLAPDASMDDASDAQHIESMAQTLDKETVQLYYQIVLNGRKDLPFAPDEISGFTMTLLRMLAFTPGSSDDAVEPLPGRSSAAPVHRPSTHGAKTSAPVTQATGKPATPAAGAANPPEGDWHQIAASLNLGGMARMLADHCELVQRDQNRMVFALDPVHKHLAEQGFKDKLVGALKAKFGEAMNISIELGVTRGLSPSEIRSREKSRRHSEAVAAIENDPFIRELVEGFDATINEASIQPIGQGDSLHSKS